MVKENPNQDSTGVLQDMYLSNLEYPVILWKPIRKKASFHPVWNPKQIK